MRILCHGSTSLNSNFTLFDYINLSFFDINCIKREISFKFNIPFESITGLYKRQYFSFFSYDIFDFQKGDDIYFIYYTLHSLYINFQYSTSQLNSDYFKPLK